MKVEIIVPTWNNEEFTIKCFESIRRHTPTNDYRLVWLDNGSTQESRDVVMPEIARHRNKIVSWCSSNLGFVKGINTALELLLDVYETDARYIALQNNDTEVTPNWLEPMITLMDNDKTIGAVGPTTDSNKQRLDQFTGSFKEVPTVTFFSVLMRTRVFREIGFLDENFGAGLFDDHDFCYDKETQIVTDNGIKYVSDVIYEDRILTMREDEVMEWHYPTRLIKKKEKTLLHFKTRRIDLMVTPDQKLLVGYRNPFGGVDKPLSFVGAKDISDKLCNRQSRYYVKKNGGIWEGKQSKTIQIGGREFATMPFVKFMGWYLSEGTCESRVDGIRIAQCDEEHKLEIASVLDSLGVDYTVCKPHIYIKCGSGLSDYCRIFGKSYEKYVPQEVKELSVEYLDAFLRAYASGDGHIGNGKISISTSSDRMKDDLVEILLKLGNTFSFWQTTGGKMVFPNGTYSCRKVWQIQSYEKNKERALIQRATEVPYDDFVYDVTVPNHRIYVIRNGKGCWSSNCHRLRTAGYRCGIALDSFVHHHHRATFKKLYTEKQLIAMHKENMAKVKRKHGI
jgi:glycosyltransferase involved in cell wall biosynthesis